MDVGRCYSLKSVFCLNSLIYFPSQAGNWSLMNNRFNQDLISDKEENGGAVVIGRTW